jgi:hypothetical protein
VRYATSYAGSDAFTMSQTGRVAIVRSSPQEPPDVITFPVNKPAEVKRLCS